MQKPLEGLRVVDTTNNRGELCGRLLADLGANVVLVEPINGSSLRETAPFGPNGESLGFLWSCLLYTSPSPRDATLSRMPSSA